MTLETDIADLREAVRHLQAQERRDLWDDIARVEQELTSLRQIESRALGGTSDALKREAHEAVEHLAIACSEFAAPYIQVEAGDVRTTADKVPEYLARALQSERRFADRVAELEKYAAELRQWGTTQARRAAARADVGGRPLYGPTRTKRVERDARGNITAIIEE
jgi:hypothetical protein